MESTWQVSLNSGENKVMTGESRATYKWVILSPCFTLFWQSCGGNTGHFQWKKVIECLQMMIKVTSLVMRGQDPLEKSSQEEEWERESAQRKSRERFRRGQSSSWLNSIQNDSRDIYSTPWSITFGDNRLDALYDKNKVTRTISLFDKLYLFCLRRKDSHRIRRVTIIWE